MLGFTSAKVPADNCCDELPDPGGGRKTPVPGARSLGGGAVVHPAEPGGIDTGAGNGMGGTTGAVTNNGGMPT